MDLKTSGVVSIALNRAVRLWTSNSALNWCRACSRFKVTSINWSSDSIFRNFSSLYCLIWSVSTKPRVVYVTFILPLLNFWLVAGSRVRTGSFSSFKNSAIGAAKVYGETTDRRWCEGGILMSSRYFATVLLEIFNPSFWKIAVISESLKGFPGFSTSISLRIFSLIVSELMSAPLIFDRALWKKNFIS